MRVHPIRMESQQIRIETDHRTPPSLWVRDEGARLGSALRTAVAPVPTKPHTLAAWLSHDFALAQSWDALRESLHDKGYLLALCGDHLIMCTVAGKTLCDTAALGQPYSKLRHQFGAPFPDPSSQRPIRQSAPSKPQ